MPRPHGGVLGVVPQHAVHLGDPALQRHRRLADAFQLPVLLLHGGCDELGLGSVAFELVDEDVQVPRGRGGQVSQRLCSTMLLRIAHRNTCPVATYV
ncbi:dephospho-CoA kinase [Babesia caballi]|uniref:Dephospho-CoA kinase n=1 Tax=Babesia caballi TaxID=5871 RepID=A0AAV4M0I8_BABCB|nr:dephospho-CoA kinase [Babesia caballi]